jgi:hypothetical protein
LQTTFGHYRAVIVSRDAQLAAIEADLNLWIPRAPFAAPVRRLAAYRGVTAMGALSLQAEVCDWRRLGRAAQMMGFERHEGLPPDQAAVTVYGTELSALVQPQRCIRWLDVPVVVPSLNGRTRPSSTRPGIASARHPHGLTVGHRRLETLGGASFQATSLRDSRASRIFVSRSFSENGFSRRAYSSPRVAPSTGCA